GAGAEWDLEYVVRRGMELAEASRDARCAGYLQLCLVDGRRDDGAGRQAAARAAEWLAESSEADRLRARARLLEVTRAPWPEGDALARRLDELEPRAEWWKARAVELLRSFDVADAELVLREARSLGSGGSHSLRGALQVVLAELELELGRTEQARGSLAEAAGHARALLEGLSDERRSVARQLPWVQKAQSLQHSAFEGEQLGDVEALLRSLSQREGLRPLLRQILDALLLWTGVERGLLLLRAPGERLIVRAARNLRRVDLSAEQLELSRSLAERALVERRPIVAVDAAGDLSDSHKSVHALSLRSVLALPLIARGQVLGVAYLDDRVRRGAFGGRELAWAQLIGSIAALTIADERDRLELLRSARKARRSAERARAELSLREVELENAERELDRSRQGRGLRGDYAAIVGNGRAMTDLLRLVDRVAQSDVPVLIQGESGSGKELIARALAHNGPRRGKTFVAENCAAVPETLLESTLFGHVRSAFTGANRARAGLFEVADGGTLLLDEVGEMSLTMQAKLLRVLQSGEIRPLGAERSRQVNVRVICATNRRLDELVERGTFREDLYYRLNVIVLSVPPLRERPEDILPLAEYFLALHSADASRSFSPAVRSRLRAHTWPGNVRQLENEVRRLVVLGEREIVLGDLSPDLLPAVLEAPEGASLRDQVDALERRLVVEALESTRGNRTRAAELLGLSRFGLQKMIERLSIAAPSLRP
ncbi:MAG TPA: sigma 54-interacting transcriptional regulator, partial [Polyangiaceae bacterium]|nr:sigma 54-interacting transcriptional regulator [Polyangiaceae bacterium]